MRTIASQVKALDVGETLVLETLDIAKTQRAVASAASKLKHTVEQKGFFGVAGNGDLESTAFIRIIRVR